MDFTVPTLRDYLEIAGAQEDITHEIHYVNQTSPYDCYLNQIPKVIAVITAQTDNLWDSVATAASLITIEIETSEDVWEAATITEASSPDEMEVFLQISNTTLYPFSPRLVFNAAHAGLQVRVSYTGIGSVPLAWYFQRLFTLLQYLPSLPISLFDEAVYHNGRFDNNGVSSTRLWASGSQTGFFDETRYQNFTGRWLNFGEDGELEVTAFTTAYAWKRLLIQAVFSGGVWTFSFVESAEAALQTNLTDPTRDPSKHTIALVDVQNNGTTGAVGEIQAIPQSQITAVFLQADTITDRTIHSVRCLGSLTTTGEIDVPFAPFHAGAFSGCGIFVENSGTAGQTRLDVLLCSAANPTGTTIFTSTANQPTVVANSESPGLDYAEETALTITDFTADSWVRFSLAEVATGAEDLHVTVHYQLSV